MDVIPRNETTGLRRWLVAFWVFRDKVFERFSGVWMRMNRVKELWYESNFFGNSLFNPWDRSTMSSIYRGEVSFRTEKRAGSSWQESNIIMVSELLEQTGNPVDGTWVPCGVKNMPCGAHNDTARFKWFFKLYGLGVQAVRFRGVLGFLVWLIHPFQVSVSRYILRILFIIGDAQVYPKLGCLQGP